MGITAFDTFTDTDGKLLENHISDSGHSWSKIYTAVNSAEIRNGKLNFLDNQYFNIYIINKTPLTPDYSLEIDIYQGDYTTGGAVARLTQNGDFYTFFWNSSGAYQLYKKTSAGWIQIGSNFVISKDYQFHKCRLEVNGNNINFYYDDVLKISAVDNDITQAGRAGLLFYPGEIQTKDNFNLIEDTGTIIVNPLAVKSFVKMKLARVRANMGFTKDFKILNSLGVNQIFTLKNQIIIGDILIILNSLTIQDLLQIKTELKDLKIGDLKILNALTNLVEGFLKIKNSIDATDIQTFILKNELADELKGILQLLNNIDSYTLQGILKLLITLSDAQKGKLLIANSIDGDIKLITEKPVFVSGADITNKVIDCTINYYGSFTIQDFSAKTADIELLNEIEISYQSDNFRFYIEEDEVDEKTKTKEIWGRTKEIDGLYYPYATKSKYNFVKVKASEIIKGILGNRAVFLCEDYLTDLVGEYYPLEAVKKVIDEIGGIVRIGRDGRVYCIYPYDNIGDSLYLDRSEITHFKRAKIKGEYDTVKVNLKDKSGNINIEAEKTEAKVGEWVKVKVWADIDYIFKTNQGIYWKKLGQKEDLIKEKIQIDNEGKGTLKYIPVRILTAGITSNGKTIYVNEECDFIEVEYITRYELYEITKTEEGQALACFIESEDGFIANVGAGKGINEISANLYDLHSAKLRAIAELAKNGDRKTFNITCLYNSELLKETLFIETTHGKGFLNSLTIRFSEGKALMDLEVLRWQRISL